VLRQKNRISLTLIFVLKKSPIKIRPPVTFGFGSNQKDNEKAKSKIILVKSYRFLFWRAIKKALIFR
jgi:hypothetical protein